VGVEYPAAAVALLARLADHLGIALDTRELEQAAAEQRAQLDAVSASRPEVRSMVEQLEAVVDAAGEVSGEQLAAEIERFLRQQSD
jgi:uncharacterized FlaG/YvyC family protein